MKKVLAIMLAVVLLIVFLSVRNNDPKTIIKRLSLNGKSTAERLRYKVYVLGFIPVAEAVFESQKLEDYNGRRVYHLSAVAGVLKIYSRLFNGSAVLDSYVDIGTLNPIAFRQKVVLKGKPDALKEVFYDQDNAVMTSASAKRQILPDTQDPLSLMLRLRRADLSAADEFSANINTNQKNYVMRGKITRQDLSIRGDDHKLLWLKAEVSRHDKNPYHKSYVTVAMLSGGENIPVFIKVFASGFVINARLVDTK